MSAIFPAVLAHHVTFQPSAILDVPKKTAIIRLRWPVVIICSYLLLYSRGGRLDPIMLHGFLLLYVLSNAALYWVDEKLFSASYFYAPLVFFDLLILAAAMNLSGEVGRDFYLAYFLTIVLCGICKDFRGWLVVTLLSPLIYGYFLIQSATRMEPILYLQIPFPFVVALFYGYFVQVENFEKSRKDHAERENQRRQAEDRIQRQLERIRTLSQINLAITSSLDFGSVLDVLQERVNLLLPDTAVAVWLVNAETGSLDPIACRNLNEEEWKSYRWGGRGFTMEVLQNREPMMVVNLPSDRRTWNPEFFRRHGLVSFLGVPLLVKDEILGVVAFYTKVEHEFSGEEKEFFSTLAAQAAIAIHNSRLYEQTKRQAVDLEKSNRVKDDFLSTMSHELRTPLNVIIGYTGMIRDGILGEINSEQEKSLQKVMIRSRDLLAMISAVLQAASLDAGVVRAESEPLNLVDFLNELRSAYAPPPNQTLTVGWDYPADLPVIKTDREKLRQILDHLIRNAIKFTPVGQLTISVHHLPQTKTVEFKVSDTGIGIPKDFLPVIFEKFRQVDSPEARINGGVGLGLYIAKRLAELLGAAIQVESELGTGSTFTVTLPYS